MKALFAVSSALGLLLATAPGAAAQEQAPVNELFVDESNDIIVQAQRRDERLQDVPIAVSVYTSEQRDLLGIENADDIAKLTPGMTYNLATVTIRGVGRSSVGQLGADPGVSNYFDGVYSDNAGSIGGAPLSVERVEVLRGPQGTLFGRNSTAGAINVISRRPSDEFEGELRLAVGNYETTRVQASLSGPLTDTLRYRLEGLYNRRGEGFVENVSGEDRSDQDDLKGSLQVEWDVTPDIQFWARYSNTTYPDASYLGPTRIDPYETTALTSGFFQNPHYGYTVQNPGSESNPYIVDENFNSRSSIVNSPQLSVDLDWDLGSTRLRYIGGTYRAKIVFEYDADYSSRVGYLSPFTSTFVSSDIRAYIAAILVSSSNELQWMSDGAGPLAWIVGVYQGHDENGGALSQYAPFQPQLDCPIGSNPMCGAPGVVTNPNRDYLYSDTFVEGDTHAFYGQADWEFAPSWTLTAGYRHTWDEKRVNTYTIANAFLPDFLSPAFSFQLLNSTYADAEEWEGDTLRAGLRFEPSDNAMIYGSISSGYKAGGFNTSIPVGVTEETVLAYEVGFKGRVADAFQLNAAVFYNDYSDLQVAVPVIPSDYGGGGASPTSVLFNADEVSTYGLELEAQWQVTDAFRMLASYAYLVGEVDEFGGLIVDPNQPLLGGQDVSGRDLPRTPRNKLALNGLYSMEFASGDLLLSATYSWVDTQYATFFQTPTYEMEAHDEVDLRATWISPNESYRIIGFVNNAFDEVYALDVGLAGYSSSTARTWVPADPRTFGVELQFNY